MKTKIVTFFISILIPVSAFGQVEFDDFIKDIGEEVRVNRPGAQITTVRAVDVEGNPYNEEGWMTASLLTGNQRTKPLTLRFNLADDNIQVRRGDNITIIYPFMIDAIEVTVPEKKTFKNGYLTFKEKNVNDETLFRVIHEGKVTILEKETVKLMKDVSSYGTATRQDYYNRSKRYYASKEDFFKKIKLRKKDILRLYPDNSKEIDRYVKQNKLKYDNEQNLMRILRYADSLTTQ